MVRIVTVTKEVLIERTRYLRDVQRSLESAVKEGIAVVIASPIVNVFVKYTLVLALIAALISSFIIYAIYGILKIQEEIKSTWGELMHKDPIYERLPPVVVFGIVAIMLVTLVLTW